MRFKLNWIVPLLIVSTTLAFSAPGQVLQTHPYGVFPETLTQTSIWTSQGFVTSVVRIVLYSWSTMRGMTFPGLTVGGHTYPGITVGPVALPQPVGTLTIPMEGGLTTKTITLKRSMTTMTTVYTTQTMQGIALEYVVGPLPFYSRSILLGALLGLAVSVPISFYRHTKLTR